MQKSFFLLLYIILIRDHFQIYISTMNWNTLTLERIIIKCKSKACWNISISCSITFSTLIYILLAGYDTSDVFYTPYHDRRWASADLRYTVICRFRRIPY